MASEPYSLTATSANPPRNSTICITGGGGGIGLATALFLHTAEYNNKIAIFDKSPTPPQASTLTSSPRFLYVQCDVLDWASQRSAFTQAASRFDGIDHVFINAGVNEIGDQIFTDAYDADGGLREPDRLTVDVDLRAVGDSLKLALHHLRNDADPATGRRRGSGRGRGGSVVMTASMAGYLAFTGAPLYSAAKHGVVGYMRALKGDCAKVGVAISVVAPGITLTSLVMGRKEGQSLEDWGREMGALGVPINSAEMIGWTVGSLMGRGKEANGEGLLVQGNRVQEAEAGLAKTRRLWMGEEMLRMFRGGRKAPLAPNKL